MVAEDELAAEAHLHFKQMGHIRIALDEGEMAVNEGGDLFGRSRPGSHILAHAADERLHLLLEDGDHQIILVLKIEIGGADGDAGFAGDVFHFGIIKTAAGKDADRGLEYFFTFT